MAQPQNNYTTLLISDPNGGQPQMIKVMSGTKIPLQLATSSGSSVNTVKTIIKSSNIEAGTILQTRKLPGRQIIALPTKQNVQGIRGPMVVPVSSVQLKTSLANSGRDSIVSPMVIRAQTRPLALGNASHMPIHLPQINVPKQVNMTTQGAVLQTQLKLTSATTAGPSVQPTTFALKTQSHLASGKPEFIFVQQKSVNNATLQQAQGQLQTVTHQLAQQVSKARISSPLPSPKPLPTSIPSIINPPPTAVIPSKSIMNTSILDHSGSRKRHDFDFDYSIDSKRRKTEKGGKGLRHFSMKVCEKVQAKGTTSYNEVADELVAEFTESTRANSPTDTANYDQKNIRRRVYDALNVLMAMNIISKERKEIRWLGLPTNSVQECMRLQQERSLLKKKIKLKQQQLQDLILQQIAFKNLVERNRRLEREGGAPSPNAAIQLPFIIVNTSKKTVIDCSISNDKTEYLFNFNDTFEIHDDIEVLKRMGMALGLDKGACSDVDLGRAKSLVPKALERYVVELSEMGVGASDGCSFPDPPPPSLRTGLAQLDAAAGPPVSNIPPSSAASSSSYADDDDDDDTGFDSDELDLG